MLGCMAYIAFGNSLDILLLNSPVTGEESKLKVQKKSCLRLDVAENQAQQQQR